MATTVGNLPVKGAIKQGGSLGTVDWGNGMREFFLCVFDGKPYLFNKYKPSGGAYGSIERFTDQSVINTSQADFGILFPILDLASQPDVQYSNLNISYVSDTAKDIYYTDGAGNFKATPYTDATTAETVTNILKAATGGSTVTAATDPLAPATPWYKQTITYVIGGIAAAGIALWLWMKK